MSEALWQNRIVELRMAKPADLRANPANFRKHPKAQRAALDGLLSEVGVVAPLMLNLRSEEQGWPEDAKETLIDGHLRHDLAESSEQAEVPVVVVDLSEDEENLVLATLDSSGAMAEKDSEKLKALLGVVKPKHRGVALLVAGLARDITPPGGECHAPGPSLADRFGVPPFSVLDARQGYWQERKRAWLGLGIQSELGRGDVMPSPGGSPRPAIKVGKDGKTRRGDGRGRLLDGQ